MCVNTTQFNHLSDDTLYLIFSNLNIRDLGRIAAVSKKWREISSSDCLWNKFQIYESPTPSPVKEYTIMAINREACFIRKIRELPPELPTYFTDFVPSCVRDTSYWKEHSKKHRKDFSLSTQDAKEINSGYNVLISFQAVVAAFDSYMTLCKIGYTNLSEAERLVVKTMDCFRNIYPLYVLAAEYMKLGNLKKVNEMERYISRIEKQKKYIL